MNYINFTRMIGARTAGTGKEYSSLVSGLLKKFGSVDVGIGCTTGATVETIGSAVNRWCTFGTVCNIWIGYCCVGAGNRCCTGNWNMLLVTNAVFGFWPVTPPGNSIDVWYCDDVGMFCKR